MKDVSMLYLLIRMDEVAYDMQLQNAEMERIRNKHR